MTCGAPVPVDHPLLEEALVELPPRVGKDPERLACDRRIAAAIFRTAIANGVLEQVEYR